jgi:hypothetical protein
MSLLAKATAKLETGKTAKVRPEGVFSMLSKKSESELGDYGKRILADYTAYNRFNLLWLLPAKPKGITLADFVGELTAEIKADPAIDATDLGFIIKASLDDKGANSSFISFVRAYNKSETGTVLKKNATVDKAKPKATLIKARK